MPINEFSNPPRPNLTQEQQRQADAAIYGMPQNAQGQPTNLTPEHAEFLRNLLFQHDAQNAAMNREFDLNNPPVKPYRYQEFPRLLYRGNRTEAAHDKRQMDAMLAAGWSMQPPEVIEEPPLEEAEANIEPPPEPATVGEVRSRRK